MTNALYDALQNAKTEEDVKDIYIKALNLKGYSKGLIDIRTDDIWFEAKHKDTKSNYAMFTQLLFYVQDALKKGDHTPPFLCVVDTEKAALMKTADVLPLLKRQHIKWGKSASSYTKQALDEVSNYIGAYLIPYIIKNDGNEFIYTVKEAIKNPEIIIRTQIIPDNLKQVFDKWVLMIGQEIADLASDKYDLLFYADIMHDGDNAINDDLVAKVKMDNKNEPMFLLYGQYYELGSKKGYYDFWKIYHRPPNLEYRKDLLERRDSLIPIDEQSLKGAYYTPLHIVDKAYDTLSDILGKNWQKNYLIWDMCCGTGNLEVKHSNHRNIFMSTLDKSDIDIIRAAKTCVRATRFQYDYLNDDINAFGQIDYNLTDKIPLALQDAIKENKDNKKKILILINPPYAEAGDGVGNSNKIGVSKTNVAETLMDNYGKASNELFTQFLARIAVEMPNATIAMFSKLKYVNAPNFEQFRKVWDAKYLGGFITHSKAFDRLTGNFPIGFLIWQANQRGKKTPIKQIDCEILDKTGKPIGTKSFYNLSNEKFLNVWLKRPKTNKQEVIPIKNAISPATSKPSVKTWSDNAIAYMRCSVNDLQHANQHTALFSSSFSDGHGFYVTPENLWQAAVIFAVRRLIKPTWINDRDQFLQPTETLSTEFKHDCLIWTLFNGSNLTASANNLEWNGKKWSIVNHFIPFTETDVGINDRFASDFMVAYLKGKKLSSESQAVLQAGKKLWQAYFTETDVFTIREAYKLNRPDVGWYQIRNALKLRNAENYGKKTDFTEFEIAYKQLTEKLSPLVYEYGFLLA